MSVLKALGVDSFLTRHVQKFHSNKEEWRKLALDIANEISKLNDRFPAQTEPAVGEQKLSILDGILKDFVS